MSVHHDISAPGSVQRGSTTKLVGTSSDFGPFSKRRGGDPRKSEQFTKAQEEPDNTDM